MPATGPGGEGYASVNPYDDRFSNANVINRGGYSTQTYGQLSRPLMSHRSLSHSS